MSVAGFFSKMCIMEEGLEMIDIHSLFLFSKAYVYRNNTNSNLQSKKARRYFEERTSRRNAENGRIEMKCKWRETRVGEVEENQNKILKKSTKSWLLDIFQ